MKLLAIQIRSCKQCYENNGIYRPCTFHHVNLDDTWIDPDCPLPEWSDNNTKELAQQHLTKQGSEPSEICHEPVCQEGGKCPYPVWERPNCGR